MNCGSPRRRSERRLPVSLSASVFCNYFDKPVEVSALDVSPSGMFLQSDLLLHAGERVLVSFQIPGSTHRVLVGADVVRTSRNGRNGMALEFGRLSGMDEKVLRAGIERCRTVRERILLDDSSMRC